MNACTLFVVVTTMARIECVIPCRHIEIVEADVPACVVNTGVNPKFLHGGLAPLGRPEPPPSVYDYVVER